MLTKDQEDLIGLIKAQTSPAVGCTEPAAAAYACAVAAQTLGGEPERICLYVSRNILKNAMGVGIPGTDRVGLPMAAALGAIRADADAGLSVLRGATADQIARAQHMADTHRVTVFLKQTDQKLYLEAILELKGHTASCVIEDSHTGVTSITKDGAQLLAQVSKAYAAEEAAAEGLSVKAIDAFVRSVDWQALTFLKDCIQINEAIALEGLQNTYGLMLGKSLYEMDGKAAPEDLKDYATALACAAADARMGGSTLPVMTSCGSGNQGLTASVPIIAVARRLNLPDEMLYRALAYSLLITIHVKHHLGKLSSLCACGVGASIGTACALTYLSGGGIAQIQSCIHNVVADVSGIICDGAKPGCSLKIATAVSSAFRGSMLAMRNLSAGISDGIVGRDAEASIDNLANLGNTGMACTDRVILDMLVCK